MVQLKKRTIRRYFPLILLLLVLSAMAILVWRIFSIPEDMPGISSTRNTGIREEASGEPGEPTAEAGIDPSGPGEAKHPMEEAVRDSTEVEESPVEPVDQGLAIEGRVYVFGRPTKDVRILATGREHSSTSLIPAWNGEAESNDEGSFRFDRLAPGRYWLSASHHCEQGTVLVSVKGEGSSPWSRNGSRSCRATGSVSTSVSWNDGILRRCASCRRSDRPALPPTARASQRSCPEAPSGKRACHPPRA